MGQSYDRIAFILIMKTAGSFVGRYLRSHVLVRHRLRRWRNYTMRNSWALGLERDWTEDELRRILAASDRRMYVHNHVDGWSKALVEAYQAKGYFTFAWARHPGDTMCSFFHWRQSRAGATSETLDTFIRNHVDSGRPWETPDWWETLDFIEPFSTEAFARFLEERFKVKFVARDRVNKSANEGYSQYLATGAISQDTHALLESSEQMRIYREVCRRAGVTP